MHFVHHSFLIHQICRVLHTSQKLRNRTALHVENVWKPVRQERWNWDRNFATKKDARLHIRGCRFLVTSHGANICGHIITVMSIVSTAMMPVQHRVKQPVRLISEYRDICSLQKKVAMRMHLHWSRKIIHFRQSAGMYVTVAAKMPAQEAQSTKLLQSMKSNALLQNVIWMQRHASFQRKQFRHWKADLKKKSQSSEPVQLVYPVHISLHWPDTNRRSLKKMQNRAVCFAMEFHPTNWRKIFWRQKLMWSVSLA